MNIWNYTSFGSNSLTRLEFRNEESPGLREDTIIETLGLLALYVNLALELRSYLR